MLERSLRDMLQTSRFSLAASVPPAVIEAAVGTEIVNGELTTGELALHKLAVRERSPPEHTFIELDADEHRAVEQPPIPLAAIKAAIQEKRRAVSAFLAEALERAVPKGVLLPVCALREIAKKFLRVDLHAPAL